MVAYWMVFFIVIVTMCVSFGIWQESVAAGIFAGCVMAIVFLREV